MYMGRYFIRARKKSTWNLPCIDWLLWSDDTVVQDHKDEWGCGWLTLELGLLSSDWQLYKTELNVYITNSEI